VEFPETLSSEVDDVLLGMERMMRGNVVVLSRTAC
jgi:hypothetical protein